MRVSAIALGLVAAIATAAISVAAAATVPALATTAIADSVIVAAAESKAWYWDPVAIVLAVVAIFAAVDLSLMLAHHLHRSGGEGSSQSRSRLGSA